MTAVSPPTSFTPARLRERVQEILSAGSLPPIVQAGNPVLRQRAASFDGQISAGELDQLIALMREVMHEAPGVGWPPRNSESRCSWQSLRTSTTSTPRPLHCATVARWSS
ncbi:peptide deformylase [Arthrobacter sp. Hiyo4]|nr:peptide deformylase [Arthrobacter sp. Hiyo4]